MLRALLVCSVLHTPPNVCVSPRQLELHGVSNTSAIALVLGLREAIELNESVVVLNIDSPGGSVTAGLGIINAMRAAQAAGVKIICRVDGMAASMGAIILEAGCSERHMTRGSQIMFHEPALRPFDGGKEGDYQRIANDLSDTNRRIATLIAWRMGMTADQYVAWVSGRDRWMDWAEALEKHAVDAVET